MIYFITGQPGSGKTLRVMWLLENDPQFKGRDVYSNIAESKFRPLPSGGWVDCPDGSVVVIDEAQHWFPQRRPGAEVPKDVSALDTHRHRGIDLIMTTQRPTGVDYHVRGLVGRHEHLRRNSGESSTMWTRNEAWDSMDRKERKAPGTECQTFNFPKELYGSYGSAVMHTHRMRIPRKVFVYGGVVLVLLLAIFFAVQHITGLAGRAGVPDMQSERGRNVVAQVQEETNRRQEHDGEKRLPRTNDACIIWESGPNENECYCYDTQSAQKIEVDWNYCQRRARGWAG